MSVFEKKGEIGRFYLRMLATATNMAQKTFVQILRASFVPEPLAVIAGRRQECQIVPSHYYGMARFYRQRGT